MTSEPHPRRRRGGDHRVDLRQCALRLPGGRCGRRRRSRPAPSRANYPTLLLRRVIVPLRDLPASTAPAGQVWLCDLASTATGKPFYAGQTSRHPRHRLASHVSYARHRRGANKRLEARLRRMARAGGTLVLRLVGLHPHAAADTAEQALIAALRDRLGPALLNLGPGGERAPVGRLVTPEQRWRSAAVLLGMLGGTARHLVVDPHLLAAARAAQAWRGEHRAAAAHAEAATTAAALAGYLAAPPGTALADIARAHSLSPTRLQERVRMRRHGVADDLAGAVRRRMDADARVRNRVHARARRRVAWRTLCWWLAAYARPGSRLTLAAVGAQVGVQASTISRMLARVGKRSPLPRRLRLACRRRARAARRAALRPGSHR